MWALQGVANAGIQLLLAIGLGYVMTACGLFSGEKFLPQVNTFLLLVSFPALNFSAIGVSLDLRDSEAWRALGAYCMWIAIIQLGVTAYVMLAGKRDVGEAGLLNLLLTANNTVIMGLPIMNATWGAVGRKTALLTGVPMFLLIMPYSIVLFELERWVVRRATSMHLTEARDRASTLGGGGGGGGGEDRSNRRGLTKLSINGSGNGSAAAAASVGVGLKQGGTAWGSPLRKLASDHNKTTSRAASPSPRSRMTVADSVLPPQPQLQDGSYGDAAAKDSSSAPSTCGLLKHAVTSTCTLGLPPCATCDTSGVDVTLQPAASAPEALSFVIPAAYLETYDVAASQHPAAAAALPRADPGPLALSLQQVQAYLRNVAEMQRARKARKRRRRGRVSVVDAPLPLCPRLQLAGQTAASSSSSSWSSSMSPAVARQLTGAVRRRGSKNVGLATRTSLVLEDSDSSGGGGTSDDSGTDAPRLRRETACSAVGDGVRVGVGSDVQGAPVWQDALRQFLNASLDDLPYLGPALLDSLKSRGPTPAHAGVSHGGGRAGNPAGEGTGTPPHGLSTGAGTGGSTAPLVSIVVHPGPPDGSPSRRNAVDPVDSSAASSAAVAADKQQRFGWAASQGIFTGCSSMLGSRCCDCASCFGGLGGCCGGGGDHTRRTTLRHALRQRSARRAAVTREALKVVAAEHGGLCGALAGFVRTHPRWWRVATILFKNPMLGSLLLSLIMSLSGLRVWLDPASPQYLPALGWVDSTASMLRGTTVPLALFSCGVFLHGKRFWRGNVAKAGVVLVLKCVVLPALMLACAKAVRLGADSGVALVLLSMTPCATTAFVVASQYNRGAEVIIMCTIVQTVLVVPLVLAGLALPNALGIYTFDSAAFPLP